MGFGTELQSPQSHESLVKLQETEIKQLEIIKKCVAHRIKCDRDYAGSLSKLAGIAHTFDNPESYTSPLFKVSFVKYILVNSLHSCHDKISNLTDRISSWTF